MSKGSFSLCKSLPKRAFAAMDKIDYEFFDYKFTHDLKFKDNVEKISCFRVIDENGKMVNKQYENSMSKELLTDCLQKMITVHETDQVFMAA